MIARAGKNFGAKLLGLAISFADRFLVVGVLLRSWGANLYAEWAILMAAAGFLALGEMGLNIYFGNLWQQHSASGDKAAFQRTLGLALAWSIALGASLAALLAAALVATDVAGALSIRLLSREDAQIVLVLLCVGTISRSMRGAVSQLYRGRQQYAVGTLVDQVQFATLAAASLLAAALGASPLILAIVFAACDIAVGWGVMIGDLKRRFPDLVFKPQCPTQAEIREIARHTKWLALQQGIPVAWLQAPVLALGVIGVGGSALVSFTIQRTLVAFARQIAMTFSFSVGVELADAVHNGHRGAVVHHLQRSAVMLSAVLTAIAVGIMEFGEPFIKLWTGQAELFDPTVSLWLLIAAAAAVPSMPLLALLTFINMVRPAAIAQIVQLGAGIICLLALAPNFGVAGAAAGLAVGDIVAFCIALPLLARKIVEFRAIQHFSRCYGAMLLTALWCALISRVVASFIEIASVPSFLAAGLLYAGLGLTPALALSLPATARLRIVALLRQPKAARHV